MNSKEIYELGHSYGKNLSSIENNQKQLGSIIQKEEIIPKLNKLKTKISLIEGKIEKTEGNIAYVKNIITQLASNLDKQNKMREKKYLFSLFIGIFFLLISFMLIYADVFLLGDVIRKLLDLEVVTIDKLTFQKAFIQSPLIALKNFPEILTMSLSILFMGFYLKVFEDTITSNNTKWSERDRKTKIFFIIEIIVGVLSVIVLLIVAYTRFKTPISTEENYNSSLQLLTAIMGFALPYISAIFFMRGYTKIKNELKLYLLYLRVYCWDIISGVLKSIVINYKKKLARYLKDKSTLTEYEYYKILDAYTIFFKNGYNDAIDQLINSSEGSLYERFKKLALRNIINPQN